MSMNERKMIDPNDAAWKHYHKIFFGTDIPESMRIKIAKPFADMVGMMLTDLSEHYDKDLDEQVRNRAVIAGLSRMRDLGIDYTGAYGNEIAVKKDAFKSMIGATNRLMEQERLNEARRQEMAEREAMPVQTEDPRAKRLHDEFDMHYQYAFDTKGLPRYESNVEAYICLLRGNNSFEGIEHYVVFRLRFEKGIQDDPAVIEALNAHPSFRDDHQPTRLKVRGEAWKGFGHSAAV